MLAGDVAVVLADGVGGGHGVVGQLKVFRDLPHQVGGRLPVRQLLAQKGVEHGTGGIQGLKLVLNGQGLENILRIAHGQVGGVGVIRRVAGVLGGGDDVGILFHIVLGQAVGGGLGGGGLQIVQVAVLLLIVGKALPHVIQNVLGKGLGLRVGQVLAQPFGVEAHLVHADEADGGEVVVKGAQVILGVRIQSRVHEAGDDGALGLEAAGGDVHDVVQPLVEFLRRLGEIRDAGQVDGDHAHGAGGLTGAEVAAGLLPQLPQVQPQPAAHGAHIGGLHVGVDVVGEIGGAVFSGHLEQEAVVLRVAPVEILGDGVGGDGILEAPAVGVALGHDLDERLVHHVHFLFAVAVGEILLLTAHDGRQVFQVLGHGPVQGDVGEGSLRAPAGGGVHAEHEGLDALLDLFLGKVVHLDEGGQIRVKGAEGLGAGPLVLHDTQEVHHLVAQGAQVAGGRGVDLAGDAEALLDELLQAPAGAVAGEHGEVVEVDVAAFVGGGDLWVIDLAEPVIGGDGAGVGQDQAAHGIGDGGVLLYPPIVDLQIVVHQVLVIQHGGFQIADLFPLLAV